MFVSSEARRKFTLLWEAIDAADVIPGCQTTDPEVWFRDGDNSTYGPARKICDRCPVRQLCLDYALANNEEFGMWGGKSPRERMKMRSEKIQRPYRPKIW